MICCVTSRADALKNKDTLARTRTRDAQHTEDPEKRATNAHAGLRRSQLESRLALRGNLNARRARSLAHWLTAGLVLFLFFFSEGGGGALCQRKGDGGEGGGREERTWKREEKERRPRGGLVFLAFLAFCFFWGSL